MKEFTYLIIYEDGMTLKYTGPCYPKPENIADPWGVLAIIKK